MPKEIIEKAGGAKLRLSFGGAQVEVNREPALRDKVYLLVAGHFSQTKLAPGEADFLLATVTGTAQVISHDQFVAYGGVVPAEQLEIPEPSAEDLEALEKELVEAGR
jgi:hypothetical protein